MQKVYLLLRNNQQSGPYNLDELVQLNLKPQDLIWIEGRSFGWSYPSEIDALKPLVQPLTDEKIFPVTEQNTTQTPGPTNNIPPKKVFVSMPGNKPQQTSTYQQPVTESIEQKAEELRKRAQSYTPSPGPVTEYNEIKTNYNRSLNEVEEDYTKWMFQKKTKKKSFETKHLMNAAFVFGVLAAGWWLTKTYITSNDATQQAVLGNKSGPVVAPAEAEEDKSEAINNLDVKNTILRKETNKKPEKEKPSPKAILKKEQLLAASEENIAEIQNEEVIPVEESSTESGAPAETGRKKKTLGETLNNLFKKKKKEEPVAEEEPKSTEITKGERRSVRRNEEVITAPEEERNNVDAESFLEARVIEPSGNWMMGVKGYKIILHNRSNQEIKRAAIEVLYYNEQKALIDKKKIYFSNIAAKKSQTLGVPEHRMADHIDYRIVSAATDEFSKTKTF